MLTRAIGNNVQFSRVAIDSKRRVLLLGGCHVASLGAELRDAFDCVQLWRRPTIALMSEPIRPVAAFGFNDRHSRYILKDCAKTHLAEIQAAKCDVLIFDVVRDVRCPLVRSGHSYLFDPNRMFNLVPDAPPASVRTIDAAALLGGAEIEPFAASDPRFFEVWSDHFHRFYAAVLAPRIAEGCIVILQQTFLAKQTAPPSDVLHSQWDYCDALNALLRRMYAHIASYPGIERIGVEEELCLTARDVPFGGPSIAHPVQEVFALMADQARAIVAPEHRTVAGPKSAQLADFMHRRAASKRHSPR